ncbi:zinc finger protein MAGPIE-like [Olea europaea var. sylvestris]|uniref:Zinc finger NUTCRACKER-like n=1 Tax=Olea europaea subsp. europaea TaxID=158383 RepID=A0A8S0Q353_OLEEU|nr:zinc finger protein MAGPIE-like [Olea europaea var. sylvestris]CAA2960411.1 zinc finger NUTCRACKER-like [Olea europaea subsp. europaea]
MIDKLISIGSTDPVSGSNPQPAVKKKRSLPGTPDPEAEVIALSPKTLMATNRFLCEICGKGFQRDQNLQLHRRGHNLPWKLKQRSSKEVRKRVYVCPEKGCVHHHPSRALGDLTGIKKHFCRKHGEKKWKCEKCSKRYAVQSDWKAHSKTCGTREYKCDCGTIFSRRDSFITHRAFCDVLTEETERVKAASQMENHAGHINYQFSLGPNMGQHFSSIFKPTSSNPQNVNYPMTRGISLWNMSQQPLQSQETLYKNLQEMHQMGISVSSGGAIYSCSDPLVNPCSSNPPAPSSSYQLNWDFAKNLNPSNAADNQLNCNSLPLSNINVKDVGNHQLAGSVPSLFSTQQQSHQQSSVANTSATALLQKAAQIGATTTDPSLIGNFGLNCTKNQVQNAVTTGLGSDFSALNQLQMYPSMSHHMQNQENFTEGETRDFLGVGIQSICHPSSINGWI